ncbi:MAG TPA: ATP-binding protein, partial [Rectinemataceae bacterium]|nr:ATP-binding protein [Rectinemataceae bacterium]
MKNMAIAHVRENADGSISEQPLSEHLDGVAKRAGNFAQVACARGLRVRFFTAAELVVRLSEAFAAGALEKLLRTILRADLLIIDEW